MPDIVPVRPTCATIVADILQHGMLPCQEIQRLREELFVAQQERDGNLAQLLACRRELAELRANVESSDLCAVSLDDLQAADDILKAQRACVSPEVPPPMPGGDGGPIG